MGRPIVAFAHGGAVESIEHEKTGRLAKPGDADSLAESLRAALSLQPRARKAYAHNARAHRSAFFNRSNVPRNAENIPPYVGQNQKNTAAR